MQRLGHLLGETAYLDASARCLNVFQGQLAQHPIAYPTLLAVLAESRVPPRVIILRGPAARVQAWVDQATPRLGVGDLMLALPNGLRVPDALDKPESDEPAAWICSGTSCQPPVSQLADWLG